MSKLSEIYTFKSARTSIDESIPSIINGINNLNDDISDLVNDNLRRALLGSSVIKRFSTQQWTDPFSKVGSRIVQLIKEHKVPTTIRKVVFKIGSGNQAPSAEFVTKKDLSIASPFRSVENILKRHVLYIRLPYKMRMYMDKDSIVSIIGNLPRELMKSIIHSSIEATAVTYIESRSTLASKTPWNFFSDPKNSDYYGTYIILRACEGSVTIQEFASTFNELLGYISSMKRVSRNSLLSMLANRKKKKSDDSDNSDDVEESSVNDPDDDSNGDDEEEVLSAIKKILSRRKDTEPKPKKKAASSNKVPDKTSPVRSKFVIISSIIDMLSRRSSSQILSPTPNDEKYLTELKQMFVLIADRSKNNEDIREKFSDWIIEVINGYRKFYPKYTSMVGDV